MRTRSHSRHFGIAFSRSQREGTLYVTTLIFPSGVGMAHRNTGLYSGSERYRLIWLAGLTTATSPLPHSPMSKSSRLNVSISVTVRAVDLVSCNQGFPQNHEEKKRTRRAIQPLPAPLSAESFRDFMDSPPFRSWLSLVVVKGVVKGVGSKFRTFSSEKGGLQPSRKNPASSGTSLAIPSAPVSTWTS